jgi:hypothetical protein
MYLRQRYCVDTHIHVIQTDTHIYIQYRQYTYRYIMIQIHTDTYRYISGTYSTGAYSPDAVIHAIREDTYRYMQ